MNGMPFSGAPEARLMIRPPPRRFISGTQARQAGQTPSVFTPMTRRQPARRPPARAVAEPLRRLGRAAHVGDDDLGSVPRETGGERTADALRAAGDHRNLARELHRLPRLGYAPRILMPYPQETGPRGRTPRRRPRSPG